MKKFMKYLYPFAPDQSGACGVFYEFGGLIVICDAGGCAGNICGFDEPRWFSRKSAVFSAGLRDMDAIMGRDDKLIEKLSKAYNQLGGNFALIVSTPVPAVIATDMKSLEKMGSKKLGIPCIALDCTGTHFYDEGEEKAWFRLFETFATDEFPKKENRIGILGATPMETGYSKAESLNSVLSLRGYKNTVLYSMGTSLEDVIKASECCKNLVVSHSALKAAKYLEEKFGIPYEVCYPFIPEEILKKIKSVKSENVLIIRSQTAANEIRKELDNPNAVCATFFGFDKESSGTNDRFLTGEDDLTSLIKENKFDCIIADLEFEKLVRDAGFDGEFMDYPEFAVSGRGFDFTQFI